MKLNPCRCHGLLTSPAQGRLWCWLDWLTFCRIPVVCNRQDEWITQAEAAKAYGRMIGANLTAEERRERGRRLRQTRRAG